MIFKHYANLAHGQTHYRRAGKGVPLVMLHASPMSSEFMVPLINEYMSIADVIAPDTPGYGQSDALTAEQLNASDDLIPYVQWLAEFIENLNLPKIILYGSATGSQIALEFARLYPEKIRGVILDNVAHFSEEECVEAMQHYFPDISPRADGSHLQQVWDMASAVFTWFPWFKQDEEHRISHNSLPTPLLHAVTMAYLSAGTEYAQAYKRAFVNEKAERVQTLTTVPVKIIRWQGSVIRKYSDRFDNYKWPDNIEMLDCEADVSARYDTIKKTITAFI